MIEIRSDDWVSGPLRVAVDRRSRLMGLRPAPGRHGLILRTRSIHTFGMRAAIGAVAVDETGRVIASRVLAPRRVWTVWSAAVVIEVASMTSLPRRGTTLTVWRAAHALDCDR